MYRDTERGAVICAQGSDFSLSYRHAALAAPTERSMTTAAIAGGTNGERLVVPLTDFVVSFALVNEELVAA